jgi:hypothetical protein
MAIADITRAVRPGLVHRVRQRQCIHDRRQHAHVVGRGAVHADRAARHAAEDVAAADHHGHFDTQAGHLGNLLHHAHDRARLMPNASSPIKASPDSLSRMRLWAGRARVMRGLLL